MKTILILASNPREDLKLNREIRDLKKAVERSSDRSQFEVEIELAVRSQDLQDLFQYHKPCIVHFCGHGTGEQGLVFEDEAGQAQTVGTQTIANLFRLFASDVDCAVFNACDTDVQAEAIVQHIDYAIGMNREILDQAAYWFAVGFYRGLGYGESIDHSYELGCNAIALQLLQAEPYRKLEPLDLIAPPIAPALPEYLKPVLRKRAQTGDRPSVLLSSDFVEAIVKEGNLKRYQDQARETWDGVGRSQLSPSQPLTQHEYRQRQVFLGKVKEFWIKGFLKRSISTEAIELGLKPRQDAVKQPFAEIPAELDQSFEQLQATSLLERIGQGKTLLILGEPGAGETIALLKLAERLVAQTAQDLGQPMPVVLNLASWAVRRLPIADWLVKELQEKYQVPKALSKPWIAEEQLILLLDGLDEVKVEYRDDCVRSLNQFIATHGVTEVVVCSRVQDYEALSEKLQLRSAICLQPLTTGQVDRFLAINESLAGLRSLVQQDPELAIFAQTPLILNIMSLAYKDWSIESLMQQFSAAENRYIHLFDTYVDRMLGRRSLLYPKEKILRWLRWLAKQMVKDEQIVFLIEKMQPTWLGTRFERRTFLIVGLIVGLIGGLIVGLIVGLLVGLLAGLSVGLIYVLIVGLLAGLSGQQIKPIEQLNWSWQKARASWSVRLIGGLIVGLLGGLIGGLIVGLIVGLIYVLIVGLLGGLESAELERKTIPNQGIWNSAKNYIIIGLIYVLIVGLIAGLIAGLIVEPIVGLIVGLIGGLIVGPLVGLLGGLNYGGAACIQHFNLRLILYHADRIPWNYARFLDFASDRLLLKKVGGGYLFYHRMLMEHMARQ